MKREGGVSTFEENRVFEKVIHEIFLFFSLFPSKKLRKGRKSEEEREKVEL